MLQARKWRNIAGCLRLAAFLSFTAAIVLPGASLAQDNPNPANPANPANPPGVFELQKLREGELQVLALLQAGQTERALAVVQGLQTQFPDSAGLHYFRSVLLARTGQNQAALEGLRKAIGLGFNNVARMRAEQAFGPIRDSEEFAELIVMAREAPQVAVSTPPVEPTPVREGIATVSAANTALEPRTNTLQSRFTFRSRLFSDPRVMGGKDSVAARLNDLYRSGKAAGNLGDLYDNRDRKHSSISAKKFPQVGFVEYAPEAVALGVDYSFNDKIFFSGSTVGNASLGVNGLGSIARQALSSQRQAAILYLQYRANTIYVYPGVRDYEFMSGLDQFPANTPYLVVSKGKSGSDRPFIEAILVAMAALPPDVKKLAIESSLLAPTVQMLLRRSQKQVLTAGDYLGPKAHPVVFNGDSIDLMSIVELAQGLTVENLPPRVDLTVLEEEILGAAAASRGGAIFNTPGAVARFLTDPNSTIRIVVSTANTIVSEGKTPVYRWVVLEGDPSRISIKPRNENGSVAELIFQWQPRQVSLSNPAVQTDRADVGVFVEINGVVSAPSFVSVYFQKK